MDVIQDILQLSDLLEIMFDSLCVCVCSIEKDSPDLNQVNQKLNELKAQFQRARESVEKLPGTQYSKEEQLRRVAILHKQMELKTNLLQKYKGKSFLKSENDQWIVIYYWLVCVCGCGCECVRRWFQVLYCGKLFRETLIGKREGTQNIVLFTSEVLLEMKWQT